ncbi:MAG TPA: hypothetical protein VG015_00360 [Candidatus Dormibacteraeota bacterium]|nr:hypothetical protein [Candidatus Dormibacteraeota bacterium]
MTRLKVSPSGQVYDIDIPQPKVTRDEGGGYYVHGWGIFIRFENRDEALAKVRDLEIQGKLGGQHR